MATNITPAQLEIELIVGQGDPLERTEDFAQELNQLLDQLRGAGLSLAQRGRMIDAMTQVPDWQKSFVPAFSIVITPAAIEELRNMLGTWIEAHPGRKVSLIDGVVQDEAETRETLVEKLNRVVWRHSAGK
jgi:hypothetical protein